MQRAARVEVWLLRGVSLDHHHRHRAARQLFDDRAAETPEAAHDDVFLETVNFAIHCALPEKLSKAPLNDKFPDYRKQVNGAADTCDYQPDCKKTTGRAQRLHLAEADRRDGDDRHVKRVEHRHVLDQDVTGCAE